MNNPQKKAPSIHRLINQGLKSAPLPVYFFYGEDTYSMDDAVKIIQNKLKDQILSDFDFEVVSGEKKINIPEIIDNAMSFPFGGGKKLLIVKNFEQISDPEKLAAYVKHPADFTVLVFCKIGNITSYDKEPYKTLFLEKYIFESKEIKGEELLIWLIGRAVYYELEIDRENAFYLIELTGEDKALLEMQLQKFYNYLDKGTRINQEVVHKLSSVTKEYDIFQLLDAMGKGDLIKSLEILDNLLKNGSDAVGIISMLTKFITTIAQITELRTKIPNDMNASKAAGVSYYYYINCKKARFFMNDHRLIAAAASLEKADLTLKTTSCEQKILLTVLISEMLSNPEK